MQEKLVSSLIENQFPQLYRDFGPMLIEFVQAYYEWLEQSGNAVYYARNFLDNHDIDKTADEFLTHFKQTYLPNIQLDTAIATKRLIKNAKPFYRARGTDRATELFFRAVFDADCEIYYPSTDLMSFSSGKWVKNTYLEVSPLPINNTFISQEIIGLESGTKAFVDDFIRRRSNGRLLDIFYISANTGDFKTGELVCIANNINVNTAPMIVGSLTSLEVVDGSYAFNNGDVVNVYSNVGYGAKAVVSNTMSETGLVNFSVKDGGWGYTSCTEVIISDTVLKLTQVNRPYVSTNPEIVYFNTIVQPYANIAFSSATGNFAINDTITTYYSNGGVSGQGTVLQLSQNNSGNSFLIASVTAGNLASNTLFYNQGNAIHANTTLGGYTDYTANGTILNLPDYNTIVYSNASGVFETGEIVNQVDINNNIISTGTINSISVSGTSGNLSISNSTIFYTNTNIIGTTSGTSAFVNSLILDIGVKSNSTFTISGNNYIYSNNYFTSGVVIATSSGFGANCNITTNFNFTENVNINTDLLGPYLSLVVNSAFGGLSTVIGSVLHYQNFNIGTITGLTGINPGINYNFSPDVSVYDPWIYPYELQDYIFNIANPTGVFLQGEVVTQTALGEKGLVTFANSSLVKIRRLKFEENWVTSNTSTTTQLVGQTSNYTANLVSYTTDTSSKYAGINATISTNVISSAGYVSNLKVIDSGFGFNRSLDQTGYGDYVDLVTFSSLDGERNGTAFALLEKQGQSEGYWEDQNGFASSTKKMYDGNYYQEFSYDVKTSIAPSKYQDMFKRLLHVAGKKWFGTIETITYTGSNTEISSLMNLS
ncbi:MAG: hypothetical protein P4L79_09850 [Legionella sp.]|uniref:hypothetical protein n=1 Tax=Legionella sp. TaxID=459 RepID=UPI0028411FD0|nr:hypothetical protein [Legionella sp.]